MESPFVFHTEKNITILCHIFGTPLAIQGISWLPLNQLFFWVLFTWRSVRKHPTWTGFKHLILGGLRMAVLLGAEWCHNLAHVAAARAVDKPVDAMRIIVGMPGLIYDEPEHPSITPRQHLIRSLGGPVCNTVLLAVSKVFQRFTPTGSTAREVADTAVGMNIFIATASLLPVPVFDGGPILKWSLIGRGISPAKAAVIATRTNQVLGPGLLGIAAVAMGKKHWLLAFILAFLGALSLAAGLGKIK